MSEPFLPLLSLKVGTDFQKSKVKMATTDVWHLRCQVFECRKQDLGGVLISLQRLQPLLFHHPNNPSYYSKNLQRMGCFSSCFCFFLSKVSLSSVHVLCDFQNSVKDKTCVRSSLFSQNPDSDAWMDLTTSNYHSRLPY
jgi:hypothetical protein